MGIIPNGVTHLIFGWDFNQQLDKITFPDSLQKLYFGYHFNQSLDNVIFPNSLQILCLSYHFNQQLDTAKFPITLKKININRNNILEKIRIRKKELFILLLIMNRNKYIFTPEIQKIIIRQLWFI